MAAIIIFLSLFLASVFGIGMMSYLGDGVVSSDLTDQIFLGIIVTGVIVAALYEISVAYEAYQKKRSLTLPGYVEHKALLVHQIMVIVTLLSAYILQQPLLVFALAVTMLLSVISLELSPFVLFYRFVLLPMGLLKTDLRQDNMRAHRFAFMIGSTVSSIATYALYNGMSSLGWGLVLLILTLASIAVIGWCAGCFLYYMLNRMGFKGYFSDCPINNDFPGTRPRRQSV